MMKLFCVVDFKVHLLYIDIYRATQPVDITEAVGLLQLINRPKKVSCTSLLYLIFIKNNAFQTMLICLVSVMNSTCKFSKTLKKMYFEHVRKDLQVFKWQHNKSL